MAYSGLINYLLYITSPVGAKSKVFDFYTPHYYSYGILRPAPKLQQLVNFRASHSILSDIRPLGCDSPVPQYSLDLTTDLLIGNRVKLSSSTHILYDRINKFNFDNQLTLSAYLETLNFWDIGENFIGPEIDTLKIFVGEDYTQDSLSGFKSIKRKVNADGGIRLKLSAIPNLLWNFIQERYGISGRQATVKVGGSVFMTTDGIFHERSVYQIPDVVRNAQQIKYLRDITSVIENSEDKEKALRDVEYNVDSYEVMISKNRVIWTTFADVNLLYEKRLYDLNPWENGSPQSKITAELDHYDKWVVMSLANNVLHGYKVPGTLSLNLRNMYNAQDQDKSPGSGSLMAKAIKDTIDPDFADFKAWEDEINKSYEDNKFFTKDKISNIIDGYLNDVDNRIDNFANNDWPIGVMDSGFNEHIKYLKYLAYTDWNENKLENDENFKSLDKDFEYVLRCMRSGRLDNFIEFNNTLHISSTSNTTLDKVINLYARKKLGFNHNMILISPYYYLKLAIRVIYMALTNPFDNLHMPASKFIKSRNNMSKFFTYFDQKLKTYNISQPIIIPLKNDSKYDKIDYGFNPYHYWWYVNIFKNTSYILDDEIIEDDIPVFPSAEAQKLSAKPLVSKEINWIAEDDENVKAKARKTAEKKIQEERSLNMDVKELVATYDRNKYHSLSQIESWKDQASMLWFNGMNSNDLNTEVNNELRATEAYRYKAMQEMNRLSEPSESAAMKYLDDAVARMESHSKNLTDNSLANLSVYQEYLINENEPVFTNHVYHYSKSKNDNFIPDSPRGNLVNLKRWLLVSLSPDLAVTMWDEDQKTKNYNALRWQFPHLKYGMNDDYTSMGYEPKYYKSGLIRSGVKSGSKDMIDAIISISSGARDTYGEKSQNMHENNTYASFAFGNTYKNGSSDAGPYNQYHALGYFFFEYILDSLNDFDYVNYLRRTKAAGHSLKSYIDIAALEDFMDSSLNLVDAQYQSASRHYNIEELDKLNIVISDDIHNTLLLEKDELKLKEDIYIIEHFFAAFQGKRLQDHFSLSTIDYNNPGNEAEMEKKFRLDKTNDYEVMKADILYLIKGVNGYTSEAHRRIKSYKSTAFSMASQVMKSLDEGIKMNKDVDYIIVLRELIETNKELFTNEDHFNIPEAIIVFDKMIRGPVSNIPESKDREEVNGTLMDVIYFLILCEKASAVYKGKALEVHNALKSALHPLVYDGNTMAGNSSYDSIVFNRFIKRFPILLPKILNVILGSQKLDHDVALMIDRKREEFNKLDLNKRAEKVGALLADNKYDTVRESALAKELNGVEKKVYKLYLKESMPINSASSSDKKIKDKAISEIFNKIHNTVLISGEYAKRCDAYKTVANTVIMNAEVDGTYFTLDGIQGSDVPDKNTIFKIAGEFFKKYQLSSQHPDSFLTPLTKNDKITYSAISEDNKDKMRLVTNPNGGFWTYLRPYNSNGVKHGRPLLINSIFKAIKNERVDVRSVLRGYDQFIRRGKGGDLKNFVFRYRDLFNIISLTKSVPSMFAYMPYLYGKYDAIPMHPIEISTALYHRNNSNGLKLGLDFDLSWQKMELERLTMLDQENFLDIYTAAIGTTMTLNAMTQQYSVYSSEGVDRKLLDEYKKSIIYSGYMSRARTNNSAKANIILGLLNIYSPRFLLDKQEVGMSKVLGLEDKGKEIKPSNRIRALLDLGLFTSSLNKTYVAMCGLDAYNANLYHNGLSENFSTTLYEKDPLQREHEMLNISFFSEHTIKARAPNEESRTHLSLFGEKSYYDVDNADKLFSNYRKLLRSITSYDTVKTMIKEHFLEYKSKTFNSPYIGSVWNNVIAEILNLNALTLYSRLGMTQTPNGRFLDEYISVPKTLNSGAYQMSLINSNFHSYLLIDLNSGRVEKIKDNITIKEMFDIYSKAEKVLIAAPEWEKDHIESYSDHISLASVRDESSSTFIHTTAGAGYNRNMLADIERSYLPSVVDSNNPLGLISSIGATMPIQTLNALLLATPDSSWEDRANTLISSLFFIMPSNSEIFITSNESKFKVEASSIVEASQNKFFDISASMLSEYSDSLKAEHLDDSITESAEAIRKRIDYMDTISRSLTKYINDINGTNQNSQPLGIGFNSLLKMLAVSVVTTDTHHNPGFKSSVKDKFTMIESSWQPTIDMLVLFQGVNSIINNSSISNIFNNKSKAGKYKNVLNRPFYVSLPLIGEDIIRKENLEELDSVSSLLYGGNYSKFTKTVKDSDISILGLSGEELDKGSVLSIGFGNAQEFSSNDSYKIILGGESSAGSAAPAATENSNKGSELGVAKKAEGYSTLELRKSNKRTGAQSTVPFITTAGFTLPGKRDAINNTLLSTYIDIKKIPFDNQELVQTTGIEEMLIFGTSVNAASYHKAAKISDLCDSGLYEPNNLLDQEDPEDDVYVKIFANKLSEFVKITKLPSCDNDIDDEIQDRSSFSTFGQDLKDKVDKIVKGVNAGMRGRSKEGFFWRVFLKELQGELHHAIKMRKNKTQEETPYHVAVLNAQRWAFGPANFERTKIKQGMREVGSKGGFEAALNYASGLGEKMELTSESKSLWNDILQRYPKTMGMIKLEYPILRNIKNDINLSTGSNVVNPEMIQVDALFKRMLNLKAMRKSQFKERRISKLKPFIVNPLHGEQFCIMPYSKESVLENTGQMRMAYELHASGFGSRFYPITTVKELNSGKEQIISEAVPNNNSSRGESVKSGAISINLPDLDVLRLTGPGVDISTFELFGSTNTSYINRTLRRIPDTGMSYINPWSIFANPFAIIDDPKSEPTDGLRLVLENSSRGYKARSDSSSQYKRLLQSSRGAITNANRKRDEVPLTALHAVVEKTLKEDIKSNIVSGQAHSEEEEILLQIEAHQNVRKNIKKSIKDNSTTLASLYQVNKGPSGDSDPSYEKPAQTLRSIQENPSSIGDSEGFITMADGFNHLNLAASLKYESNLMGIDINVLVSSLNMNYVYQKIKSNPSKYLENLSNIKAQLSNLQKSEDGVRASDVMGILAADLLGTSRYIFEQSESISDTNKFANMYSKFLETDAWISSEQDYAYAELVGQIYKSQECFLQHHEYYDASMPQYFNRDEYLSQIKNSTKYVDLTSMDVERETVTSFCSFKGPAFSIPINLIPIKSIYNNFIFSSQLFEPVKMVKIFDVYKGLETVGFLTIRPVVQYELLITTEVDIVIRKETASGFKTPVSARYSFGKCDGVFHGAGLVLNHILHNFNFMGINFNIYWELFSMAGPKGYYFQFDSGFDAVFDEVEGVKVYSIDAFVQNQSFKVA